jgi:hypothetical protein
MGCFRWVPAGVVALGLVIPERSSTLSRFLFARYSEALRLIFKLSTVGMGLP